MPCGEHHPNTLLVTSSCTVLSVQDEATVHGTRAAELCLTCCRSVEVGIHGYWGSYANIFELTRQLGIYPFTDWTPSNQYSPEGLEVVAPIFRVSAAPPPF